jgi:chromosome segregation ATPase
MFTLEFNKMTIREIWTKTSDWLKAHKISPVTNSQPEVDDQGLIAQDAESPESAVQQQEAGDKIVVKPAQRADKRESLEKLQAGFDALIEKLHSINEHLNRQVAQQDELMRRIEQFPQLIEGFPELLENQKQIIEQLLAQLKSAAAKDQQFIDAVEKIPAETSKQTDALVDIDHQLAAAADTDVQMAESFNKFNETLDKLNESTVSQTDSIMQMSRTFATSDRYLKYIISRQNKRFTWIFIAAVGVCAAVILILTGIIIYLRH